jgi:glycosyltransferase involved in cell wall biosynthesis
MNFLSICLIVKNEEKYLPEWLEFHLLQGVDHFYIYDNDPSNPATKAICDKYKEVTYIPFVGKVAQLNAYHHYLGIFGKQSKWTAFIDADEFLYTTEYSIKAKLQYLNASALAVHWYLFGSNGEKEYRDELVIRRFTRRQNDVNPHVKSIVRNEKVISVGKDSHSFDLIDQAVDEHGKELTKHYALHFNGTCDTIRINHYHCKSYNEAKERWQTPRADTGGMRNKDFDEHFTAHDRNDVEDTSATFYADTIKIRLKERFGEA